MEPFSITEGNSAIITAAIHEGHYIRPGLLPYLNLDEHERSREEDPYTDYLSEVSGNRVIVNVSRFEVDLNRPRGKAVYQKPADAWGLQVWKSELPASFVRNSLKLYDAFYLLMEKLLQDTIERFGHFAILDLHTYNYKRGGQQSETDEEQNPEINIGTVHNNPKWRPQIDHFITTLSGAKINEQTPDVRENAKFMGGEFSRWICKQFGMSGLVLSIEFKKVFMDELTGIVDIYHLRDIKRSLSFTIDELKEQLSLSNLS